MTNNDPKGANNYSGNGQRAHRHLRQYFENTCPIGEPFPCTGRGMKGVPLQRSTLQALRKPYPQLSQRKLANLFSAVKNFHDLRLNK